MSFLKFFWRDFKSDLSFNRFFILCSSLGIIGLLLVESFKGGIEDKVVKNSKNFIASDLSISSRRDFNPIEKTALERYFNSQNLGVVQWVETYSLISTVSTSKTSSLETISKLADLNFVSEEFPYYGGVVLESFGFLGNGQWSSLHASPIAWVSRDLAWEFKVKRGDKLKIGEMIFIVGGIISEDKFSSFRGFNLAPKVFISYRYLKETDLVKFGSTATHIYALKISPDKDIKKIKTEIRRLIPDRAIKIMGPEESSEQVARSLNLLSDYLSLITLLTYLLSLVGLYYFSQHFLSKKLKTLSIYKALGIKTSFLFRVSFIHLIILTLISVLISTSFVMVLLPFFENFFSNLIRESLLFRLPFKALIHILFLSLGGSLLALGPLFWGALQTPVATIFQDLPTELKRIKNFYFIPLFLYVVALAFFLAKSFKVGGSFIISLCLLVAIAGVLFKLLTVYLEKRARTFSFINRHASLALSRYFRSSFAIFICLLIGMTFTTFIYQLDGSLRKEFTKTDQSKRPGLFMFDLQDSQATKFLDLVNVQKWQQTIFAPMIRARLIKINQSFTQKISSQRESDFATREQQDSERMRDRGVNLSYRSNLSKSEEIVEGQFSQKTCDQNSALCEISLEEGYAKRVGLKLGDKLTFDISGVEFLGIVTSLRKVKWTSFEPNFFILFQAGAIDDAPKTYLTSFIVRSDQEKKLIFSKVAQLFPNVSLIDISETIKKITTIFDLMAMAIKFISLLSLFSALIVLMAVSFNHLELRKKEMVLFFMLGLKERFIQKIFVREFLFLIAFCFFLSLLLGSVLCSFFMKYIFDSSPIFRLSLVIPLMAGIGFALFWIVFARVRSLVKMKSLF